MSPPGLKVSSWRRITNSPRMNETTGPKRIWCSVLDGSGDESKIGCYKEQYCIGTWNIRSMNQVKLYTVKQEIVGTMIISDHFTCLLRNLYAGQETTVITCMEQLNGSRSRKECNRAVCWHRVCLTYTLSTSWEMLGWMSYKLEWRFAGKTSATSEMQMIPL